MSNATHERILDYADEALDAMYLNSFVDNYRIRELRFGFPWLDKPVDYDPINGPFNMNLPGSYILENVERNKRGFKKCVDAIITLLLIKRRGQFVVDRDVLGLIISRVWDTRCTIGWTN